MHSPRCRSFASSCCSPRSIMEARDIRGLQSCWAPEVCMLSQWSHFSWNHASAILNQWVNSPRFQSSATEQKPEVLWLVLLFWPISHIHPHATRGYSRQFHEWSIVVIAGIRPEVLQGVIGGSRRPAWRMPSLHPIRPEGCLTMGCVNNPGGHFCGRVSTVSSRVWHDIFFSRSCTLCFDWIMCRSIRFGAPIVWLVVNVYPWDDQTTNQPMVRNPQQAAAAATGSTRRQASVDSKFKLFFPKGGRAGEEVKAATAWLNQRCSRYSDSFPRVTLDGFFLGSLWWGWGGDTY